MNYTEITSNNYFPDSPQMYGISCDISKFPKLPPNTTLPQIANDAITSKKIIDNFWDHYIYIGHVKPTLSILDLFPSIKNITPFDAIILSELKWQDRYVVYLNNVLHCPTYGTLSGHYFVKASNPILSTLFPIAPVNILGDFYESKVTLTTDLISIPPKNSILSTTDLEFLTKLTDICNVTAEADHVKLELHKITNKLKILYTSLPDTYKSQLNSIILKIESLAKDNSFQTRKIDIDL